MIEAAAIQGYDGATISRVVELAGVSRATFYQNFACREECFMAAYGLKVEQVRAALRAVIEAAEPEKLPGAVLDALLSALLADPAGARFILVEALALPSAARLPHERVLGAVQRLVAGFLDQQPLNAAIQIPAVSLSMGVGQVLAARALGGGIGERPRLHADLLRWLDTYRLSDGARPLFQSGWRELGRFSRTVSPRSEKTALLPRGRSSLPEEKKAELRRGRILDATARIVAREGYMSLTVARIVAEARLPRTSFYAHFDTKSEAVLATQTHGLQEAMAVAAAEYSPPAPWPERVWRAMRAFLEHVAEKPDHARLEFIESFAAGSAAIRHRRQGQLAFGLFLEEGYRQSPRAAELPRVCSEAIGGAVFGLMRGLVVEEKTERMLSLLPAAAYTILAPFIGPQEALSRVQEWARAAR